MKYIERIGCDKLNTLLFSSPMFGNCENRKLSTQEKNYFQRQSNFWEQCSWLLSRHAWAGQAGYSIYIYIYFLRSQWSKTRALSSNRIFWVTARVGRFVNGSFCRKSLRNWSQLFLRRTIKFFLIKKSATLCCGHFSSAIFIAGNSQPLI